MECSSCGARNGHSSVTLLRKLRLMGVTGQSVALRTMKPRPVCWVECVGSAGMSLLNQVPWLAAEVVNTAIAAKLAIEKIPSAFILTSDSSAPTRALRTKLDLPGTVNVARLFHFVSAVVVSKSYAGSLTVTLRPPCGRFDSASSPPCDWMMERATVRPKPTPPVSRLRESSMR